jgi:hypothetical protein
MIEDVVSIMMDLLDELENEMELLNQHLDDVKMERIDPVRISMNEILDRMMTERIDGSKE